FNYFPPPALNVTLGSIGANFLGTGFDSFTVDWINPLGVSDHGTTSLEGPVPPGPISLTPGGSLTNMALNLTVPTTPASTFYELVINWQKPASALAYYSASILTPAVSRENDLPLPPALLLFGSALVGLTALGRRKRQRAAV